MMRRILVNHAESRKAGKRGSGQKLQSDETVDVSFEENLDLLALDEALKKLAGFDEQKSKIVEMRFFGGLTMWKKRKSIWHTPLKSGRRSNRRANSTRIKAKISPPPN